MAQRPTQRAAVKVREVCDVVKVQPVAPCQCLDCGAGVVAEVFVVDGVELRVCDEITHIGVLHGDDPVVGQQGRHPRDEVVQGWNMSHDVVGDDHVC